VLAKHYLKYNPSWNHFKFDEIGIFGYVWSYGMLECLFFSGSYAGKQLLRSFPERFNLLFLHYSVWLMMESVVGNVTSAGSHNRLYLTSRSRLQQTTVCCLIYFINVWLLLLLLISLLFSTRWHKACRVKYCK